MLLETQLILIDLFMSKKVFRKKLEKIRRLFKLEMGNEALKFQNLNLTFKKYTCSTRFYYHKFLSKIIIRKFYLQY